MFKTVRNTIYSTLAIALIAGAAPAAIMLSQPAMARGAGGSDVEVNPALSFMLATHDSYYRTMPRYSNDCQYRDVRTDRCYTGSGYIIHRS